MKLIQSAVAVLLCALAFGCSEEAPKLVPPPKPGEKIKNVGSKMTFNPQVDILFVVDDSGSMYTHQKNLIANIEKFTDGLKGNQILDYHIGVITTSIGEPGPYSKARGGNGKLVGDVKFVDRNTPDGIKKLSENLLVGTSGDAYEMMFDPVKAAFVGPHAQTVNAGFYRPDAHLAVIFITDAEDQSEDLGPDTYYQFLLGLKNNDQARLLNYAVYVPSAVKDCARDESTLPARIERFLSLSSGIAFGLCDADYGTKLATLADDLLLKVGRMMYLSRRPLPSTIVVTFGAQLIPNDPDTGWTYDASRNALVFGRNVKLLPQPAGTRLEVGFVAADRE